MGACEHFANFPALPLIGVEGTAGKAYNRNKLLLPPRGWRNYEKNCSHYETDRIEISGTIIRKYISEKEIPDEIMLRREIFDAILGCKKIFIE